MMEAALGISVFLEDRAAYDRAIAKFRARVPAFIYLTTDGALPARPGRQQHRHPRRRSSTTGTARPPSSTACPRRPAATSPTPATASSSISHVAETTRIQGQDLYPELRDRLRHALGFHARYELDAAVPSWLCGGIGHRGLGPITEVGFNALNFRMGIGMSNTQTYTESRRPPGTNNLFVAWETLTHAGNPN